MDGTFSDAQRAHLKNSLQTTTDAQVCRRCGALLAWDKGRTVAEVAREFGVTRQTLCNWRKRVQDGIGRLDDRPRSGRPTVWTAERMADLRHALEHSPRDFGFHLTGWTTGLLQRLLRQTRVFTSRKTACGASSMSWDTFGSGFVTHCVPIRNVVKKRRIRRARQGLPAGTAVLFEDETEVTLFPPLRSGWTKRGMPAEVVISGGNAKRVVFGSLSLTGHRLLLVRRHQRSEDFQAFLRLIHDHYRGHPVWMLLDGDSSHTAAGSEGLAEELGIALEWLPVRSPELNAIEDLWGEAKDAVCCESPVP